MNERIKLLAEQAEQHAHEQNDKYGVRFKTEYNRKFAELIVEEMYVFMCNSTDNDKPWPSFKEVKEHFGVEEK